MDYEQLLEATTAANQALAKQPLGYGPNRDLAVAVLVAAILFRQPR